MLSRKKRNKKCKWRDVQPHRSCAKFLTKTQAPANFCNELLLNVCYIAEKLEKMFKVFEEITNIKTTAWIIR